jgi:sulfatase modifying factor 1
MTNCGASRETCCASLEVEGGTYFRTYTSGSGPTAEADPATLSTFRLDKYLVTVGRFRRFVDAWNGGNGWTPVASAGKHEHLNAGAGLANSGTPGTYETGWLAPDDANLAPTDINLTATCEPYATWTPTAAGNENLPIICTNWFEAYAFCIWDGGFLPSEAEWEYAAAGGGQQRLYPWGGVRPGTDNQYAIYGCFYPSILPCTGFTNIAPVGTATAGGGLWGQLDLAGDVWEWNLDWDSAYVDPCTDCAYLAAASNRINRGGYFSGDAASLVPSNRGSCTPEGRFTDIGFRCARVP